MSNSLKKKTIQKAKKSLKQNKVVKPKTLFGEYILFSKNHKKKFHYTCQICGKCNSLNKDKDPLNRIVCHHILPVKYFGVMSPLLTDPSNILVVCQYCHFTVCHRQSISILYTNGVFAGNARRNDLLNADNLINNNISQINKRLLKQYG